MDMTVRRSSITMTMPICYDYFSKKLNCNQAGTLASTMRGRGQAESAVGGSGRIVAMLLRIIYYTEVFMCCVGIYICFQSRKVG